MEKPLETAWVGPDVGWCRASGNHQGRANSVSQVDRDSDMVSTCWLCRGGLSKRTMASASICAWVQAAPPAVTLMLDNSVSPCIFLVPFKLLPQHWSSEFMGPRKSMCGPFKRKCLRLQQPSVSLSLNPCWFSHTDVMGISLPCSGTLG